MFYLLLVNFRWITLTRSRMHAWYIHAHIHTYTHTLLNFVLRIPCIVNHKSITINQQCTIFVFITQLYYIKTLKTTCFDPCGIIVREYYISYWIKHLETNLYIVNS